ncbi:hypothetical protein SDJN02_14450, partial [Cucurbita argyrosperma subsp. argyrosperma]
MSLISARPSMPRVYRSAIEVRINRQRQRETKKKKQKLVEKQARAMNKTYCCDVDFAIVKFPRSLKLTIKVMKEGDRLYNLEIGGDDEWS